MLWKTKRPIYREVSKRLLMPRRSHRVEANLARINQLTKEGDVIIVPGKVLGVGEMDHRITVASLGASKSALQKLEMAKCEHVDIATLVERNPTGSGVKLFY
ncbi:MAG: 50S ribosomal protein L18e [Promethearchaeota archaeon]